MEDHRKSIRIPLTATAKIIHGRNNSFYTCTRNVSREGIGLYSCSALNEGIEVKIEITFKDTMGKDRIETLYGTIEWQYKWNWIYVLGVKFTQLLDYKTSQGLLEYVERCEQLILEDNI